jgi:hypothetical protein
MGSERYGRGTSSGPKLPTARQATDDDGHLVFTVVREAPIGTNDAPRPRAVIEVTNAMTTRGPWRLGRPRRSNVAP